MRLTNYGVVLLIKSDEINFFLYVQNALGPVLVGYCINKQHRKLICSFFAEELKYEEIIKDFLSLKSFFLFFFLENTHLLILTYLLPSS